MWPTSCIMGPIMFSAIGHTQASEFGHDTTLTRAWKCSCRAPKDTATTSVPPPVVVVKLPTQRFVSISDHFGNNLAFFKILVQDDLADKGRTNTCSIRGSSQCIDYPRPRRSEGRAYIRPSIQHTIVEIKLLRRHDIAIKYVLVVYR